MKDNENLLQKSSIKGLDKRLSIVMDYLLRKDPILYKTKTNVAEAVGFPRTNFSAALKGEEKYLTDNIVNKFVLAFPELSKDWLLTGEGEMLKGDGVGKRMKEPSVQPVPEENYMMVEYEDLSVKAGLLGGSDINILPEKKTRLVPREYAKGYYLVVSVSGNSMDDGTKRSLSDGEEILIRQFEDRMENLPIRNKLFVIVTNEGAVVKQVKNINKEEKKITCHSFNPQWEDYTIEFSDVLQIFIVEKKVSSKIVF